MMSLDVGKGVPRTRGNVPQMQFRRLILIGVPRTRGDEPWFSGYDEFAGSDEAAARATG